MPTKHKRKDWKEKEFEGITPDEITWARMAAFIDGEGTILINPRTGTSKIGMKTAGFYLKVSISNTDVRLIKWLKDTFGGNAQFSWQTKKSKRCFHWSCPSYRAAWILHNCLPYFIIKREQAEIAIALQETMSQNLRGRGTMVPEHINETRRDLKNKLLVLKKRGIEGYTEFNSLEKIETA